MEEGGCDLKEKDGPRANSILSDEVSIYVFTRFDDLFHLELADLLGKFE